LKASHHLHESVLQRAFSEARLKAGLFKHAGCHTLPIHSPGYNVKETAVRHAVMRQFNMQSNPATEAVNKAKLEFINTDLVKLIHNIHSGDELSVHPTWEFHLRRQIADWLSVGK
jgi:hypothetical protein